jgi:hypothetical protein
VTPALCPSWPADCGSSGRFLKAGRLPTNNFVDKQTVGLLPARSIRLGQHLPIFHNQSAHFLLRLFLFLLLAFTGSKQTHLSSSSSPLFELNQIIFKYFQDHHDNLSVPFHL